MDATMGDGGPTVCMLVPEEETGPYYAPLEEIRQDIRSNSDGDGGVSAGVVLQLEVTIVDTTKSCAPVKNAAVDIWHCDARGYYAGFEQNDPDQMVGSGSSFTYTPPNNYLRGVQMTDESGVARFTTIYPGYYYGRTIHIHVEVHTDGTASATKYSGGHVCHTGQLYFDDSVTAMVQQVDPYSQPRQSTRVTNDQDSIYTGQSGADALVVLTALGSSPSAGYKATITLGVDPTASPVPPPTG
jgi:protocatechuate 3,4-dioxygenase beta subunit